MIVVTGATGNIGGELLRLLSATGAPVRALSRRPYQGPPLPGVEWMIADLGRAGGLASSFAGAERLFLVTGNVENLVRAQKNAIAAARDAGVRHVVKVSALGASDHSKSVIGLWHFVVETELKRSGLDWTILRPHVFMQNVLAQRDAIRSQHVVRSPAGDAAVPMIDTRDIAAVAAAALTEPGHAGKSYTLTGPAPIGWREVAEILSDVLGVPIHYVPESDDDAWHRLHREGLPAWLIGAQLALAEYQRQGGGTGIVTDTVERVTGRAPRSFRDFALDHAAAFAPGSGPPA